MSCDREVTWPDQHLSGCVPRRGLTFTRGIVWWWNCLNDCPIALGAKVGKFYDWCEACEGLHQKEEE